MERAVTQRAVGASDEAADFVALLEVELPGAYRFAGYLLGDTAEADDATSEAMFRAWQSRRRLRDPNRFPAWFGRIVANVCRDRMRRRHGVKLVELGVEAGDRRGGDAFREALARDEVGRLVRRLSEDQQIVIALRFWRDLSLEEIADRLDLPLGTVKSRLHYAMKQLRKELDQEGTVAR